MKTGLRHSQVRTSLVVLACLIGSKGAAFPETPLGASDSQPTITVQVYNYSRASLAVVADAEREAGRILGAAGLKTVWLECPVAPVSGSAQGSCQKAPEAVDLRLRVLGSPARHKFQDTVFGFALHPVLASVYFDYASRRAHNDDAEFEAPLVLSCAIAHELGHLLLGTDSHSSQESCNLDGNQFNSGSSRSGVCFLPPSSRSEFVQTHACEPKFEATLRRRRLQLH